MHPNLIFRRASADYALALVRERASGQITVNGSGGLLAAHIPVLLSEDGASIDLHLVRSNPILRELNDPQPALLCISGPDGYVSLDWYGISLGGLARELDVSKTSVVTVSQGHQRSAPQTKVNET